MFELNDTWQQLMRVYEADHQHPVNRALHTVGIPILLWSLVCALSIVGLPLALPLFVLGWILQFLGHAFEGKKPSFVNDKRQMVVGALWWTRKIGLKLVA